MTEALVREIAEAIGAWLSVLLSWVESNGGAITALATIVIAAFTVFLAKSTKRLWKEAKRNSDIAKDLADAAKASLDLARGQFVSSHRPRLIVRRVSIDDAEEKGRAQDGIEAKYVVANIGDTPAKIAETSTRFYKATGALPASPPYGEA
jgi:hypothetical protein